VVESLWWGEPRRVIGSNHRDAVLSGAIVAIGPRLTRPDTQRTRPVSLPGGVSRAVNASLTMEVHLSPLQIPGVLGFAVPSKRGAATSSVGPISGARPTSSQAAPGL